MSGVTTVCLVGVGGQGILLAASILSEAASADGLVVKASEIHGMAQRGGSVVSTVRFGEKVVLARLQARATSCSPPSCWRATAACGCSATAARWCARSVPSSRPGSVLRREEQYPEDLAAEAAARGVRLVAVDAEGAGPRGRHGQGRQRRAARRGQHRVPVRRGLVGDGHRARRAGQDPRRQRARLRAGPGGRGRRGSAAGVTPRAARGAAAAAAGRAPRRHHVREEPRCRSRERGS